MPLQTPIGSLLTASKATSKLALVCGHQWVACRGCNVCNEAASCRRRASSQSAPSHVPLGHGQQLCRWQVLAVQVRLPWSRAAGVLQAAQERHHRWDRRCRITRPQQRKLPSRCLLKWHLVEVSLFAPEPQLGLLLVPNQ